MDKKILEGLYLDAKEVYKDAKEVYERAEKAYNEASNDWKKAGLPGSGPLYEVMSSLLSAKNNAPTNVENARVAMKEAGDRLAAFGQLQVTNAPSTTEHGMYIIIWVCFLLYTVMLCQFGACVWCVELHGFAIWSSVCIVESA